MTETTTVTCLECLNLDARTEGFVEFTIDADGVTHSAWSVALGNPVRACEFARRWAEVTETVRASMGAGIYEP